MQTLPNLDMLETRLKQIEEEREAILTLISIWKGQPLANKPAPAPSEHKIVPKSYSVRGRVVDGIIELIHAKGRQVSNKEILEHLSEKGISLGDTRNKQAMLAAILSQEVRKKSARLRKVARGVYDIK